MLKYMVVSRKFIVLEVFSLSSPRVHTRNMSSINLFQIRVFFWSGAEVSRCISQLSMEMFAKLCAKGVPIAVPWICT